MRMLLALAALIALVCPAMASDAGKRQALLDAYPGLFSFEGNDLVWTDGTRMVWDDGKARTPEQLIESPDIEDMFTYVYPLVARGELTPAVDFDPGRVRNEAFFRKLYGNSAGAIERQLSTVSFGDHAKARLIKLFGIADKVRTVGAEMALADGLAVYADNPGGGFNWRVIAGTDLLSVHSFGAAMDINTEYSDYWLWAKDGGNTIPYKNRIPLAIARLFEAQGFIWGGRWYHYDTMHFEYRPELIIYANAR